MDTLSFARHIHTANHETPPRQVSIDTVARRYARADAVFIEDHGVFMPPSSPHDADPGPMILHGCEWATPVHPSGRVQDPHHVGLLGVDALEQSRVQIHGFDAPALMRQKVHQAGGALVLNHPEYPYINTMASAESLAYTLPLAEAEAFDAVELFNDVGFRSGSPANVLSWVERNFYARGLYPAMVGGQDDHGPAPIATEPTYTLAGVTSRDEDGVMGALRAGRTYVSKSLETRLTLRVDGQSAWERPGSLSPGAHRLEATFSGLPDGAIVELVRQGIVAARTVVRDNQAFLGLDLTTGTGVDYAYVRVWRSPGELHTVSSAVALSPARAETGDAASSPGLMPASPEHVGEETH